MLIDVFDIDSGDKLWSYRSNYIPQVGQRIFKRKDSLNRTKYMVVLVDVVINEETFRRPPLSITDYYEVQVKKQG